MYCKNCNQELIVHADNTIACSCDLWRAGDAIPEGWAICTSAKATLADLEAIAVEGNGVQGEDGGWIDGVRVSE